MTTAVNAHISSIVGPLTAAIDAQVDLDNAAGLHRLAAQNGLDTHSAEDVHAAWWALDKAANSLAVAIAYAPDGPVMDTIIRATLLRLSRQYEPATDAHAAIDAFIAA